MKAGEWAKHAIEVDISMSRSQLPDLLDRLKKLIPPEWLDPCDLCFSDDNLDKSFILILIPVQLFKTFVQLSLDRLFAFGLLFQLLF